MSEQLRLSASQLSLFKSCKRAWYYRYVEKVKIPKKPWLQTGIDFHECIENKYKKLLGEEVKDIIYDSELVKMVDFAWEQGILYTPNKFLIEKEIKIPIDEKIHMIGKIDLLDITNGKIVDHKTVKSKKYALDENDLRKDLQLNIYGYWYFLKLPQKKCVYYRHNQLHKIASDLTTYTEVKVSRDSVEKYWNFVVLPIVYEVQKYAEHKTKEHFPCNLSNCSNYGGCDYKYNCDKQKTLSL